MNHLSRLLSILTILKSKRITTGPELADRFAVSLRTIYRDIRKLEESGVPIITIEGRGYSILDGYMVAPIMFDEMEVNALITAEQLIAKTNDDSLIKHFEQTLHKIKSVFKSALQSKGELLNNKMYVFKSKGQEAKSSSLAYIQMAIINFRVTDLTYVSLKEETTTRKIEPVAIYSYDEKWIVIERPQSLYYLKTKYYLCLQKMLLTNGQNTAVLINGKKHGLNCIMSIVSAWKWKVSKDFPNELKEWKP